MNVSEIGNKWDWWHVRHTVTGYETNLHVSKGNAHLDNLYTKDGFLNETVFTNYSCENMWSFIFELKMETFDSKMKVPKPDINNVKRTHSNQQMNVQNQKLTTNEVGKLYACNNEDKK